ncbi:MAG: tetratricopeptide repeat protein [Candidatus Hydrogenedentes bacterium]|nr:tetratricopeptide repeat protein [Candidatus Hydrogenedentota bacterium]
MGKATITHARAVLTAWSLVLIIGFAAIATGDYAMLRYAQFLKSQDYEAFVSDAGICIENKDYAGAQAALREALRLAPDAPSPQVMRGHFHYHRQEWRAAIEAYKKAQKLGSTDIGLLQNIVWAHIELGEFTEAAEFGERSIAEANAGPRLPLYTAEAFFRAGKYAKAVPYLKAALALEPDNAYVMERLRVAAQRGGDPKTAAEMARKIADMNALDLETP